MQYHKRISLHHLKINDITRLEKIILKLGYDKDDFRFNHFGTHDIELIISNQELHRDLKTIRRTKYQKFNN